MPSCFLSSHSPSPRWSTFSFNGFIDADLIFSFAKINSTLRVEVGAIPCIPKSKKTEFSPPSTLVSHAIGRANSDLYIEEILKQDKFPIIIHFRENKECPGLAFLVFHRKEGTIEGRIQESDNPHLIQIHTLIDECRPAALASRHA